MEERTIKNIPAIPLVTMLGAIQAVIGLIVGIIMAIFSTAFTTWMEQQSATTGISGLGPLIGVAWVIIMPIGMFISGFIQGLITAVIYNFLAPRLGGIKLRFETEGHSPPPPA